MLELKARLQARLGVTRTSNSKEPHLLSVDSTAVSKNTTIVRRSSLSENIQHLLHKATILEDEHRVEWKAEKLLQRRKFLTDKAKFKNVMKPSDVASKENGDPHDVNNVLPSVEAPNVKDTGLSAAKQRVYMKKMSDIVIQLDIERTRLSKIESDICRYENSLQSISLSTSGNQCIKSSRGRNLSGDDSVLVPQEETTNLSPIKPEGEPVDSIIEFDKIRPVSGMNSFIYTDDEPSRASSQVSRRMIASIKLNNDKFYLQKKQKGYSQLNSTKLRS